MQGKVIAITRSKDDSEEFIRLMSDAKAKAISLPTIELVSKGNDMVDEFLDAIRNDDPDYSVFMSSKAVKLLFDTAKKISKYEKLQLAIANTTVIAVGPKTKSALELEGIRVSHVPDRFSSVGVGEVFTTLNAEGKKAIIPRSGASTPLLASCTCITARCSACWPKPACRASACPGAPARSIRTWRSSRPRSSASPRSPPAACS